MTNIPVCLDFAVTQILRGIAVLVAITGFAPAAEVRAQSPLLPHHVGPVLPVDRGPLPVMTRPSSTASSEQPDPACPGDECARTSATATPISCDRATAGGDKRSGMYAPRHAEISLTRRHGTYLVRGTVNGCLTFDFHLDSGAADVTLPRSLFEQLRAARAVSAAEIAGSDTYFMADGRSSTQAIFLIRTLQIGPMVVHDVRAAVMPDNSPPLLGMSFLSRFNTWSINNHREVLSLYTGSRPSDRY